MFLLEDVLGGVQDVSLNDTELISLADDVEFALHTQSVMAIFLRYCNMAWCITCLRPSRYNFSL